MNQLIATFYTQPEGTDPNTDSAFESHLHYLNQDNLYVLMDESDPTPILSSITMPSIERCLLEAKNHFED